MSLLCITLGLGLGLGVELDELVVYHLTGLALLFIKIHHLGIGLGLGLGLQEDTRYRRLRGWIIKAC